MSSSRPSSFLRPGKVVLLVLLALLVYGIGLVLTVPAGWVWQQARQEIRLPRGLEVQAVTGTVWDGQVSLRFQGRALSADWALGLPSLSAMALPVRLELATASSELSGDVTLGWPLSASLDARGRLHIAEFEDLIRQSGGAILEGDVRINRLQLAWADNRLTEARGMGYWPGGQVTWPMGDTRQSAQFPAMEADINQSEAGVSLKIRQQGEQAPAAEADILRNGQLRVQVYKRLIDLAGQPWSGAAAPGDVVFKVQQPLLPGGRF